MQQRISIQQTAPEAYKALYPLEKYFTACSLETTHRNFIKIRASQINGCAYCINLHTKEAIEAGELEQRIYLLNAWKEVNIFTEQEKALLALMEAVTLIQHHVPDEAYTNAKTFLMKNILTQIIAAIAAIYFWNRIANTTQVQLQ